MSNESLKAKLDAYNAEYAKQTAKHPERVGLKHKNLYTPLDLEGFDYERDLGFPGEYPYTRGVQPTMYRGRLWTMRMYAGFATAEESNKRYRYLIANGGSGLSVAFDLPTQIGYDSDDKMAEGEIGKVGVAIDTLKDMEILFDQIDLGKVSTSMTINAPASVLLAMYIAVAEKQGVPASALRGTIQNDILKEYSARGTYIFPVKPSMRLITNIFEYCSKNVPKWNTISISGYHIQECGATCDLELGYTLADGMEYIRCGEKAGLPVDAFAKRLSFFWDQGKNYFMEIAKMRAARVLWAKILKSFGAENPKSMALRTHSQTSGWSLTEQDPFNNIARTCMEAMSAALGHTQSLHTNALDEAIALPTDFSARLARNTQLYIQDETKSCKIIDPWGGSYYVEYLTNEVIKRAWAHIQEVEALGGMSKAIATGLPKMRIEECAARRQADIDSGKETIVGLNKYRLAKEDPLNVLSIDNTAVREAQIKRLEKLRSIRDPEAVRRDLEAITKCAESRDNGNLLEAAVQAAHEQVLRREAFSGNHEKVSGRYNAVIHTVSGVYSSEFEDSSKLNEAKSLVETFEKLEGRRPRIFFAKMGQDGHDRGQKVLATSFADMGWDVDVGPLFQTPEEAAQDAVDNDVHIVGFSSLAAGHKTLLPSIVEELKKLGRDDILVCIGGVIPPQDYQFLYDHGAQAIFGPGTNIPECCIKLLQMLVDRAKEEQVREG